VKEWRLVESASQMRESLAARPIPAAADPLDSLEWREVDGELRLVER
jgi:hypothetical protein